MSDIENSMFLVLVKLFVSTDTLQNAYIHVRGINEVSFLILFWHKMHPVVVIWNGHEHSAITCKFIHVVLSKYMNLQIQLIIY